MSESDTQQPDREPDLEGREAVLGHIEQEENQQIAEHAEGESTRERLLSAKQKREQEAPPFEHTFEEAETDEAELDSLLVGETFEFRPFPKELKSMFEEAVLKFAGADEDELTTEQAQRMDEVNEAILEALHEHATDPTLDRAFWKRMTDMEDRQIMAGQLLDTQGK